MSNPARAPKELTATQLAMRITPDAFISDIDAVRRRFAELKQVEKAREVLAELDMDMVPTIVVPKEHTICESIRNAPVSKALARADNAGLDFRVRSRYGKGAANAMYGMLPEEGQINRASVAEAMADKVYVNAGTTATLGRLRKAYPVKGGVAPAEPVTAEEAQLAIDHCGMRMGDRMPEALRPYPLTPSPTDPVAITVNPNSDNGFPVLGKWKDDGAAQMCMGLAVSVREELESAYRRSGFSGVFHWVRDAEEARTWLVACKGKAKADYYSKAKAENMQMRFYNAFPRQIVLNMQMATQPFEANSRHILNSSSYSSIGISLPHGGADELVAALDRMLDEEGHAYTHYGDDSWLVVRDGADLVFLALDCSNFDLTQHGSVTLEVHQAMAAELAHIDKPAAALWFAYARERVVVTAGALTRRWRHAGPSGMPLQSKVNDALMEVLLMRTVGRLDRAGDEAAYNATLEAVGEGMGFKVRVEQYRRVRANTIRDALKEFAFLYIGYYFHNSHGDGIVRVHADVPRTMAQLPYPGLKWTQTETELRVTEAMRLGAIAMSLGLPTPELRPAFEAYREYALTLLQSTLDAGINVSDHKLRWAVQESPWGPEVAPNLAGLANALRRDPVLLWLQREPQLPAVSAFLTGEWAEEVEAEEEALAKAEGSNIQRPRALAVHRLRLRMARRPTHPVTPANDGRPPPTAVWGPDKPKRDQGAQVLRTQPGGSSRMRRGAVLWEEDDDASFDEDWGMDYADYE